MDMRQSAARRYRWDMPATQSAFGTEVVAKRSLLGSAVASPRVASLCVALLAAVSVASVAMIVFNPFSGTDGGAFSSTRPAVEAASAASTGTAQQPAATLADAIVEPAEAAETATAQQPAQPAPPQPASATAEARTDTADTALAADVEPLTPDDPRWAGASSRANPLTIAKNTPEAAGRTETAFAGDRYASVATTLPKAAAERTPDEQEQAEIGTSAPKASSAGMGTARIRTSVNMRSRGASGASVLGVVPTGAEVAIAEGCQHWCKIVYNGRTGYVYKSFVRR